MDRFHRDYLAEFLWFFHRHGTNSPLLHRPMASTQLSAKKLSPSAANKNKLNKTSGNRGFQHQPTPIAEKAIAVIVRAATHKNSSESCLR